MTDHVKLFIVMCNLLIGAALAAYIFQAYRRYAHPVLRPVFYHVICINLLVLLLFATKYYDLNIGAEVFEISDESRNMLTVFLLYFFFIGFSCASLGIYLAFMGKKVTRALKRWVAASIAVLVAGIFLEPLFAEGSLPAVVHYHFYENFGIVFILLELGLMIALPIKAGKLRDREQVKVVRAFSFLYISRYLVIMALVIVPQPFRLLFALLYLNSVPYLWYRFFMLPLILRINTRARQATDLDGIAECYRLSPREAEILGLIMAGKSNRDMEESLFISYHTVKNHVYNLYRKVGVKTRFELLHLVSNGGKGVTG